jgi:hypothetical protein
MSLRSRLLFTYPLTLEMSLRSRLLFTYPLNSRNVLEIQVAFYLPLEIQVTFYLLLKAVCTSMFHRHTLTWRESSNALQMGEMRIAHHRATVALPSRRSLDSAGQCLYICLPPTPPAYQVPIVAFCITTLRQGHLDYLDGAGLSH